MRLTGALLIIWGGLLVPLTLPWTWGYRPQLGLIASLDEMTLRVMGEGVPYAGVVSVSVVMVGLGMTWITLGIALGTDWDGGVSRSRRALPPVATPPAAADNQALAEEAMGDRPIDPMKLH